MSTYYFLEAVQVLFKKSTEAEIRQILGKCLKYVPDRVGRGGPNTPTMQLEDVNCDAEAKSDLSDIESEDSIFD